MSQSRNFPDFIDAYMKYATDNFAPDMFHMWAGISAVAGALTKRVAVKLKPKLNIYPNLYIMFVAGPGIGKSTAGNNAVSLIRDLRSEGKRITHLIPEKISEAKLYDIMGKDKENPDIIHYQMGTKTIYENPGYYYASEAASSFKEVYGDLKDIFTDLYDCRPVYTRSTLKHGDKTIVGASLNILACCTFDYLSQLINRDSILGGFASRFIYVIQKEKFKRVVTWPNDSHIAECTELYMALLHDLSEIGKLAGFFSADEPFKHLYNAYMVNHDEELNHASSERVAAMISRKPTNLLKLAMVMSVSESSDLILKEQHWYRALKLIEGLQVNNSVVIANSDKKSPLGLTRMIAFYIHENGNEVTVNELKKHCHLNEYDVLAIDRAIENMFGQHIISKDISRGTLRLLVDPNEYL